MTAAKALEFSIDLGFVTAILDGDSEIVMKALMDDSPSLASFGLLIWDVKTYAEQFQGSNFSNVGRKGNSVTHNLSKHVQHVIGFPV